MYAKILTLNRYFNEVTPNVLMLVIIYLKLFICMKETILFLFKTINMIKGLTGCIEGISNMKKSKICSLLK